MDDTPSEETRRAAFTLMEQALALLDTIDASIPAALLDHAIAAMGLREDTP